MSIQHVAWVLEHSAASGTDRLVLLSLANHANEHDECWPSLACIAHEANVGERRAQQCLASLVDSGRIERIINAGPDRRHRPDRRPNLYRLVLYPERQSWNAIRPERGAEDVTPSGERGERIGSNGVKESVERGAEDCTLTIREPTEEPSLLRDIDADVTAAEFEAFWQQYPKRNGKRLGRANALKQWKRLPTRDRRVAVVAVANYAASGQIPKDPERWLRDKCFEDWLEPAVNETPRQRSRAANRAAIHQALEQRENP